MGNKTLLLALLHRAKCLCTVLREASADEIISDHAMTGRLHTSPISSFEIDRCLVDVNNKRGAVITLYSRVGDALRLGTFSPFDIENLFGQLSGDGNSAVTSLVQEHGLADTEAAAQVL